MSVTGIRRRGGCRRGGCEDRAGWPGWGAFGPRKKRPSVRDGRGGEPEPLGPGCDLGVLRPVRPGDRPGTAALARGAAVDTRRPTDAPARLHEGGHSVGVPVVVEVRPGGQVDAVRVDALERLDLVEVL